jgi:hypothetical protein
MKHYFPTGRRNYGRPLKTLLDTWDRNGSTSGPTPWEICDDDDDLYLSTRIWPRSTTLCLPISSNILKWDMQRTVLHGVRQITYCIISIINNYVILSKRVLFHKLIIPH